MERGSPRDLRLALTGDVMLGRGIDQILPHPGDPVLFESGAASSALLYLELAVEAHGAIPRPADETYVWGDALPMLQWLKPDLRIVNLETSISRSGRPVPKGINYRMSPDNVGCLKACAIDCCVLANNHVLDWGEAGLRETLAALDGAEIAAVGAGHDAAAAEGPAILPVAGKGRGLIFARGFAGAGIPRDWSARLDAPGIAFLAAPSAAAAARLGRHLAAIRQPGDVAVASLHWGANWGHRIAAEDREFAHRLIDEAGFDIVHGHSSHHAKAIELHHGKPILYGCGDFINDYEGISGYEAFRAELCALYLVEMAPITRVLRRLRLFPFEIRNFRLRRALPPDAAWLCATLDRESRRFGTRVALGADGALDVTAAAAG